MSTTIFFVFVAFITTASCQLQSYCKVTSPDTLGPYYKNGAPLRNDTVCTTQKMLNTLIVSGRITGDQCLHGIPSILDIWQADEKGEYSDGKFNYACRSRIATDPQGYYKFATIFPARYMQGNGYRPSHIHYMVQSVEPVSYGTFITQLYFKNDTFLAPKDSCGAACNSGDPTRQAELKVSDDGRTLEVTFNIALKKQWIKN